MHEHVTLLPPEARSDERGLSSSLPADLLEQVRGRLRLLTMLILIAFAFDPVLYFLAWSAATLARLPLTTGSFARTGFLALNAGAVVASTLLFHQAASIGKGAVQPAGGRQRRRHVDRRPGSRMVVRAPAHPGLIANGIGSALTQKAGVPCSP